MPKCNGVGSARMKSRNRLETTLPPPSRTAHEPPRGVRETGVGRDPESRTGSIRLCGYSLGARYCDRHAVQTKGPRLDVSLGPFVISEELLVADAYSLDPLRLRRNIVDVERHDVARLHVRER